MTRSGRGDRRDAPGRAARKSYRIDAEKVSRAQRVLGTANETETIRRALDLVILNEAALVGAVRQFVRRGRGHIDGVDGARP